MQYLDLYDDSAEEMEPNEGVKPTLVKEEVEPRRSSSLSDQVYQGLNQQEKLKKDDIDKQPREFLPKRSEKDKRYRDDKDKYKLKYDKDKYRGRDRDDGSRYRERSNYDRRTSHYYKDNRYSRDDSRKSDRGSYRDYKDRRGSSKYYYEKDRRRRSSSKEKIPDRRQKSRSKSVEKIVPKERNSKSPPAPAVCKKPEINSTSSSTSTSDQEVATKPSLLPLAAPPVALKVNPEVELPSYYNPNVINVNKYAEQMKKRKLLWSSKKEEPVNNANKWTNTKFSQDSDGKVASKFLRLMGIKDATATSTAEVSHPDTSKKSSEDMFSTMEHQYEVARAVTHMNRGVGLGFASKPF